MSEIGEVPTKLHRIRLIGDERLDLEAIRDHKKPEMRKGTKAMEAAVLV
jgi:hypothetical protein